MRLIAVDDEINAIHVLLNETINLRGADFRFFKDDVENILPYVAANHIDGAFLDINMPNINGVDLAEKILALAPFVKFVFITGLSASMNDLPEKVRQRTLGFLYKPYNGDKLVEFIDAIGGNNRVMNIKTFGSFECFIGQKVVAFSSSKSKELFALLVTYNGKSLTMLDAISQLWPDHDVERAKRLYRDAVWRLRKTLRDVNINCVNFNRASLLLDKTNLTCDMWEYAEGTRSDYGGEFLRGYDWSQPYRLRLEALRK